MKKLSLFLLSLVVLLFSCSKQQTVKLIFLETTDVHGKIFPYNFVDNKPANNSLAQVSYYVKQLRKHPDSVVILLDNGDILQGDPSVYYYNFIDTLDKHLVARVLNYMNYDAQTIGNHDIEAGHPVYDKIVKEYNFPVLGANAVRERDGEPYFKPYVILKRSGVKIAILGLTTPGVPNWLPPILYEGIVFEDMIKSARYWVKYIQENENPDLLIGLFHSGHDYTYGGRDSSDCCNENASWLIAKKVPGFDFIFIGHDHDYYLDTVVNVAGDTVYIVDPGSHARFIGRVDVTLKWNKKLKKYEPIKIVPRIISTENIPVDEEFMSLFEQDYKKIKDYVDDTIGYLTQTLDGRLAYFGDNAFIDLIHDVQLSVSGADISFAAPLSFRAIIDSGAVTVGELFKLYRYENMLYVMRLKGSEIKNYLEYSVNMWFNTMHSSDDHLLLFKPGTNRLKNRYYNFDNAEGIYYTVDVSAQPGHKVQIKGFTNGQPFDTAKYYSVAINSYRGNGGGGHLTKGAGIPKDSLLTRLEFSTERDLRYYIMQYLKQKGTLTPYKDYKYAKKNWTLEPKQWVEKAAQRDYELLFGEQE